MSKPLRSAAALSAPRRAQWRALGLSDEDLLKPKIAVVNSSSELAICFSHLDGVAKVVKEAIRAAGGIPFEVRTTVRFIPKEEKTQTGKRRTAKIKTRRTK